jgi:D-beta-D-heptose 7-phosphate kinase/D-beta-D-heptose 1-phosphate adenosyltransferase
MNTRLIDLIARTGTPRITVVGDIILDSYIQGRTNRISPEAPIQVLEVQAERDALGGAANVAANLKNLGARVDLCGVVGGDRLGELLLKKLEDLDIGASGVLVDKTRPTVNKTRVVAQNQQLVRIDREVRASLAPEMADRLLDVTHPLIDQSSVVVLSDYAKGVLSPITLRSIIEKSSAPVLVDPKSRDLKRYQGCRLITPNRKEAEEATGLELKGPSDLRRAAAILFEKLGVQEVVITLGADGIYYATRDEDHLVPAQSRSVYDVTGAGDTVIALLAFCIASGLGLDDAVRIANAGAGIVVGKPGVAAPDRRELIAYFSFGSTRYVEKMVTWEQAADIAKNIQRNGERLVFTNGCFDLIHSGHMGYLRSAKGMGDYLMVGVNSDDSVRRLKGAGRPILSLEERMEILASLQMVDFVVSFSEDTPLSLIQSVTPQVLVKGEDWEEKGVVGRTWVEEQGGEVVLVPLKKGVSTTGVIQRVLDRYGGSIS